MRVQQTQHIGYNTEELSIANTSAMTRLFPIRHFQQSIMQASNNKNRLVISEHFAIAFLCTSFLSSTHLSLPTNTTSMPQYFTHSTQHRRICLRFSSATHTL